MKRSAEAVALTVGNYGVFVVFPQPCGQSRGQTKNEGQSNADLTLGKIGRTCRPAQNPAVFRPLVQGALRTVGTVLLMLSGLTAW